jgi:RimJ/RimL family protein N-acetyltransferase
VEWDPPEPRLHEAGIVLRPFQVSDAPAVARACRDSDILHFTFMQDGLTESGAVEWINRATESWPKGYPRFAIVDADDDHLLGQVGLAVNAEQLSAEGYYWVVASERRQGVASHALGLVADWGFTKGIERLFLLIQPENDASNGLAAKMGFVREGLLRSYEVVKDKRPDLVSWSLLPHDPRPWHT